MHNGVPVPPFSEEAMIDGFADDLAVFVTMKRLEHVEVYATKTVIAVKSWLKRAWLTLAYEKA